MSYLWMTTGVIMVFAFIIYVKWCEMQERMPHINGMVWGGLAVALIFVACAMRFFGI